MYVCDISFKDYVNYTVNVNCLGFTIITIDSTKIDEYHQKCIKEIAEKYDVNIELIKLIDSKIIIPVNKLSHNLLIDYNTQVQIKFEDMELRNITLIKLCCCNENYIPGIENLNYKINEIIQFSKQLATKYTIEQLTKRKSNGSLSKKVQDNIYNNYTDIINMKLNSDNYIKLGLTEKDLNKYITKQLNKDDLYCFNFVLYIYSLSSDEYNIIKENVQLKLKKEEEIFNKKIEPIIQEKVKEVSLNYDRIIKKLIANNETHVNELNSIIEELKKNGEQASIELLAIIEKKDKLEVENNELIEKNKELEFHNNELDKKHNQMWEEDYEFFNKLISKTTLSQLDLNRENNRDED